MFYDIFYEKMYKILYHKHYEWYNDIDITDYIW